MRPDARLEQIRNRVSPTPSIAFLKIATDIREYERHNSLEKTAEVSRELRLQERNILEAFYKEAFVKQLGNALWQAGKSGVQAGWKSQSPSMMRQINAAKQGATRGWQAAGGSKAVGQAKRYAGKQYQAGKKYLGKNMALAGNAMQKQSSEDEDLFKVAQYMTLGGLNLVQANNLTADTSLYASSLEKLAATGVLNYKLHQIIQNPESSESLIKEAKDLGRENNAHSFEILRGLVKESGARMDAFASSTKKALKGDSKGFSFGSFFGGGKDSKPTGLGARMAANKRSGQTNLSSSGTAKPNGQ